MWRTLSNGTRRVLTTLSVIIALAVIIPVLFLFVRALNAPAASFIRIFQSPATYRVITNTLLLTLTVTVLAMFIAVPAAFLTIRTDLKYRKIWKILLIIPLVIPSYVGAFSLIAFLGPRGSIVHNWLAGFGVGRLPSIYGYPGAIIVLTIFTYPYLLLTTQAALSNLNPRLEEAARSLGESSWGVFRRVTLPQLLPAIGAGGLLVALYTLGDFGAVSLLHFNSFTRVIYLEYNFSFDRHTAAFYSLLLVILVFLFLKLENRLKNYYKSASRRSEQTATRKPLKLGNWQIPAQIFLSLVIIPGVIMPTAVCSYWMIRGLLSGETLGISWQPVFNSISVSLAAAGLCLLISLPIAIFSSQEKRFSKIIEKSTYVGYALPGLVVGLALIFFSINTLPFIYQTVFLLLFGYVIRFLPQSIGTVKDSAMQINPELIEAAQSLGHGSLPVTRKVILPLLKPGMFAGAALVFLTTMKELPATLLLRPTGFETMATQIWQSTEEAFLAQAGSNGLILILSSLLILGLVFNYNLDFIK